MQQHKVLLVLLGGLLSCGVVLAAPPAASTLPLYAGTPPGGAATQDEEIDEDFGGGRVVRNVTSPRLTVFLPEKGHANGAGVIVAPGGAFMMLSIDREGEDVARWFADRGVAAFVLRYRLQHTYANKLLFSAQLAKKVFELQHRDGDDMPELPGEAEATADLGQALRLVRQRAGDWGVDPARTGVLGFSAGGIAALRVATESGKDSRPAFVAAIYASKALRRPVSSDAPPLFAAIAGDDPFFPAGAGALYAAWRKAGVPAELHVYDRGGHGFGIKPQGLSSDHWIDELAWWLEARGFLKSVTH